MNPMGRKIQRSSVRSKPAPQLGSTRFTPAPRFSSSLSTPATPATPAASKSDAVRGSFINSTIETKPLPIPKPLHHSLTTSGPAGSGLRAAPFEVAFAAVNLISPNRRNEFVLTGGTAMPSPGSTPNERRGHPGLAGSPRKIPQCSRLWQTLQKKSMDL